MENADGLETTARHWAVASVTLAIGMTVLDSAIANVALPVIAPAISAPAPQTPSGSSTLTSSPS